MEPNTILLIVYFVSMVITFVLLCYMGLDRQDFLSRSDMLQIAIVSIVPFANTFFAVILTVVVCLLGDSPVHRWLSKPAYTRKRKD